MFHLAFVCCVVYFVDMYIARATWPSTNGKSYESIYLRESYRDGTHVRKRNIANLTYCDPKEIAAIELALRHKNNLTALASLEQIELHQGPSVGAVWTVYQVAQQLGLRKILGEEFSGHLALWQVLARVLEQGSRLSAVRLAQVHAAGAVLGWQRGFNENDLYDNLTWLSAQQKDIENRLFARRGKEKPQLFLYDVTSSYLEGDHNAFGAYGYGRDGKKNKKQIVIGLLCDQGGEPVSVEVFRGNTQDTQTFAAQVNKASERFGCERVTFVGDRGMIKSGQIADLVKVGFHYITAITKPQIATLLKAGILQMELFDSAVCEVAQDGVRYVLRRNPVRAEELAASRADKQARVEQLMVKRNGYLGEHPRAAVATAEKAVRARIQRLKIDDWLQVEVQGRTLVLRVDAGAREEAAQLDGCYVIKTDLPVSAASKQEVHDRYKDLTQVEQAFRTCKTTHLETRPIHVRTEAHTRAHVLVVMLAYLIRRVLSRAWAALDIRLPDVLPDVKVRVDTRKKLPERRKPR